VKTILSWSLLAIIICSGIVTAQEPDVNTFKPKNQVGFVFSMAETGSGLGGFISWPLFGRMHFGFSLDVYFLRDSNQIDFITWNGVPASINKKNNVYLFDAMLNLKRRFFEDDLDDSFRPFLAAGIGPYYGINFPESNQTDSGVPLSDQYLWTVGGYLGAGVDISVNEKLFIGIRGNYRIVPFSDYLGERENHSMFELRFEIGQRY